MLYEIPTYVDVTLYYIVSYGDEGGGDRDFGGRAVCSGSEYPPPKDQRRIPQQVCGAGATAQRGRSSERAGKGLCVYWPD